MRAKELDGIRGIAILLVIIFHFSPRLLPIGWVGVDLFFALSGFLITGILLDHPKLLDFYRRRAIRILPLYWLFLVFFVDQDRLWYWTFTSNWHTCCTNARTYAPAGQFWSLAIEEQFYLLWPLVVRNVNRRKLLLVCGASMITCCAARNLPLLQDLNARSGTFFYHLTPFRIDALLYGAAGAILVKMGKDPGRWILPAGALGLSILAGIFWTSGVSTTSPAMTRVGYSAMGLGFGSLVLLGYLGQGSKATAWLRTPVLQLFGRYSYCMYVVHLVINGLVDQMLHERGVAALCVKVLITFSIGAASWRWFEGPLLEKFRSASGDLGLPTGRFPWRRNVQKSELAAANHRTFPRFGMRWRYTLLNIAKYSGLIRTKRPASRTR